MATREQIFPALPISTSAGRVVASPFQFLLTGEENLRVTSWCSLAGVTVAIQGRRLSTAGVIETFAFVHRPTSDRLSRTELFPLGPGPLLNTTAFVTEALPEYGQVFVLIELVRGLGGSPPVLGTLLQGYVTRNEKLAWPGTPLQSSLDGPGFIGNEVDVQGVPAGQELNIAIASFVRRELLSFMARLVTSSAAGTRRANLDLYHENVFVMRASSPFTQAPSDTRFWSWVGGFTYETSLTTTMGIGAWPLHLPLTNNSALRTATEGLTAFDQWDFWVLHYREHIAVYL